MAFATSPFFWALLSMSGMVLATSIFSGHRWARSAPFVATALVLVTVGRVVLVLPFCPQPRLEPAPWQPIAGGALLALGLAIGALGMGVRWWTPPERGMRLATGGVRRFVRHPIYLCEVLWFLGWALLFRSIWGLGLAVVFWFAILVHALAEEAALERALGDEYRRYAARVRGRILPGLPF